MRRSWCSTGIPNHVRLFYSKDDQGLARVTPKQLLESCLRMKPDRILLAELRAEEAFDYLRNVNSGHPGSITSIHAGSCELAFEQLVLLVKQSPGGRELARADIKSLLYLLVDVVIQFGVERHERFIKEIWYDPERRRRRLAASRLSPGFGRELSRCVAAARRGAQSLASYLAGLAISVVDARRSARGDTAHDRALWLLLRRPGRRFGTG